MILHDHIKFDVVFMVLRIDILCIVYGTTFYVVFMVGVGAKLRC